MQIALQTFTVGATRYVLEDNTIFLQMEELTRYHKGEYDWVTYKTIDFADENDANMIFRVMRSMYLSGFDGGIEHAKRKFQDNIRNMLND